MAKRSKDEIRETVREGYRAIIAPPAATGAGDNGGQSRGDKDRSSSCCGPASAAGPSCCGASNMDEAEQLARTLGYGADELSDLPEGANLGLSCGNPVALASLRPGETLLDLGSGGGFDVFIGGRRVGPTGRAIGVDMTPEMISRARKNTAAYREKTGLDNAEFRLGEIEHLPVADNSIDVVVSNCVINLSPDKPQVWREIARVLKPGGRVAVSDLALLQPLPASVAQMVEALIGCVAGAILVEETERMVHDAGLTELVLEKHTEYIESMTEWQDPLYKKILEHLPEGTTPSDYVTSLSISARKPAASGPCCG